MRRLHFRLSPGAVTPFHMDPEHNILLQIAGEKTFTIYPADRTSATRRMKRFTALTATAISRMIPSMMRRLSRMC
ncbi:MAG: hypothetical protein R3C58_04235 [Parvularculaceae bacterium]